jgi:hypothetical protein
MIRQLVFAAALLAPGAAYAANPSATFSDQVVSAGSDPIACDIGPPYTGQIPAGAVRAGYTHCAVNLDFTQFTDVNQFIYCMGATSGNALLYCNTNDPKNSPFDSSHLAIVSDGGSNSLQMSYLASDFAAGQIYNQLYSFQLVGSSLGGPYTGWTVGNGYYVEGVWREASNPTYSGSSGTTTGGVYAPFFYEPVCCSTAWFEVDFDETWSNGGFNGNGPYGDSPGGPYYPSPSCCVNPSPLPNFSQYITVGTRLTSDGSANTSACFYLDNGIVNGSQDSAAQFGCLTLNGAPLNSSIWTERDALTFGGLGPGAEVGTGQVTSVSGNDVIMVKRYTIWTCANWRDNNQTLNQGTPQCYPGELTGTP